MPSLPNLRTLVLILALLIYPLNSAYNRLHVLGAFRKPTTSLLSTASTHATATFTASDSAPFRVSEPFLVEEIKQAEDFAYHAPSGLIFFAAQGNTRSRYGWWPPLGHLDRPEDADTADGQIWVLDTKSWEPKHIPILDWEGAFITHGLDIFAPINDASTVYLHAINHRPAAGPGAPVKTADSVVEIFQIDLSTYTASHLRTVKHELVTTPNDIYSLGPDEFYVTNDHMHRSGLMRTAEDILTFGPFSRTNIVHVKASASDVSARVVKTGIHSANGLGHTPTGEVMLNSAAGGSLSILSPTDLSTLDKVQFDTTVDNPTFFPDLQATERSNASAYVIAGLTEAAHLAERSRDPEKQIPSVIQLARKRKRDGKWEKRKLLEDDGTWLNGATTAMLLPVGDHGTKSKSKSNTGKREFWVVATGFFAKGVAIAKVDLTSWAESA